MEVVGSAYDLHTISTRCILHVEFHYKTIIDILRSRGIHHWIFLYISMYSDLYARVLTGDSHVLYIIDFSVLLKLFHRGDL